MSSLLAALIHDGVPVFTLLTGVVAVIWGACAVLVITSCLLGALVVLGMRALTHACRGRLRRRRLGGRSRLVDSDDGDQVAVGITSLDRYRRWHRRSRPAEPSPDEDPA